MQPQYTEGMSGFSTITIIYNPNSTGPSERLAKQFAADLRKAMPKQGIDLITTERAGHAEELAERAACASARPLIISASGDGGYHEVVNGAMKANNKGCEPTTGLLPAGNANDHYTELHDADLIETIRSGRTQQVDLLSLRTTVEGKTFERYAHSYIGFGLTPKVGLELNKTSLNPIKEAYIVTKALLFLRPIRLVVDGKERTYDSVICSNIHKMSKILSLSKQAQTDDGLFEITAFRRRSKLRLIYSLLRATTLGLHGDRQAAEYAFASTAKLLVQLDGEVHTIDANSDVLVRCDKQALRCIV